jgi:ribosomal protein S25
MKLDDFKNFLYRERQAVDAVATTVKTNMASLMAILAAVAIPLVPAIFSANGVYVQTLNWSEDWRRWAAIATAVAIEGAGMFLSILTTKTYSAWQKKAATVKEIYAMAGAVGIYTLIVVVLITMSDVPWSLKVIVALIPILGVAFYVGMGFETDLANRLDEAAAEKRQKREERQAAKRTTQRSAKSPQASRVPKRKWRQVAADIARENPQISGAKLAEQLGASERTGQNILNELERAGVIHRNGHASGEARRGEGER